MMLTPVFNVLVDTATCLSNPCVNGGTCVDGLNLFTCRCDAGFMGVTCDVGKISLTNYCMLCVHNWLNSCLVVNLCIRQLFGT